MDSDTNSGSASDLGENDATHSVENAPEGDACTETAVDGTEETITSPHRLTLKKIYMLD